MILKKIVNYKLNLISANLIKYYSIESSILVERTKENHTNKDIEINQTTEGPMIKKYQEFLKNDDTELELTKILDFDCSIMLSQETDDDKDVTSVLIEKINSIDLNRLHSLPNCSNNIRLTIEKNYTLMKLLKLGVNIEKIIKFYGSEKLHTIDWNHHVLPIISFLLNEAPFNMDQIAYIITDYFPILKTSQSSISEIFELFKSRNLEDKEIVTILSTCPRIFGKKSKQLQKTIYFITHCLNAQNHEVNNIIVKNPGLLVRVERLKANILIIRNLGFSLPILKNIVLNNPTVLSINSDNIIENFRFLHLSLGISHELIGYSKYALVSNPFRMNRLKYLIYLKRLQLDPIKELYTPLDLILFGYEEDFCANIAHTSLEEYSEFCKTL